MYYDSVIWHHSSISLEITSLTQLYCYGESHDKVSDLVVIIFDVLERDWMVLNEWE